MLIVVYAECLAFCYAEFHCAECCYVVVMLSGRVILSERYAECCYVFFMLSGPYSESRYVECPYGECCYAKWRYAECHYAEWSLCWVSLC